jgi:hypothetical protein
LLISGDPFGREAPNRKLSELWTYVGARLPRSARLSDCGLAAIGGEFGADHIIVFVRMPEPLRETEAYFTALVYPKSWIVSMCQLLGPRKVMPNVHCYLLAKSSVPGTEGSGATLRGIKRDGHGAVGFGLPISAQSFLDEVRSALGNPERWITWVQSPTWDLFMHARKTGGTSGAI